ncbi:MAG: MFS transporter, partial [Tsuneonella troitsensis]
EQGQVGGIVASLNGAAYIVAPALGVWLYGHHETIGFVTICALCAAVFVYGWRKLDSDVALEAQSPREG